MKPLTLTLIFGPARAALAERVSADLRRARYAAFVALYGLLLVSLTRNILAILLLFRSRLVRITLRALTRCIYALPTCPIRSVYCICAGAAYSEYPCVLHTSTCVCYMRGRGYYAYMCVCGV